MAKTPPQIGEDTKITLDFKTIGMIVGFVITLSGMWYTLQADIQEAMVKPEPVIKVRFVFITKPCKFAYTKT